MESAARSKEPSATLPAEYWQADSTGHGALVDNVSTEGLMLWAVRDMPVGEKLTVCIFYADDYGLGSIRAVASVISKGLDFSEDRKGYRYELVFVHIDETNHEKLKALHNYLEPEQKPGREGIAVVTPSLEKTNPPQLPKQDFLTESTTKCKYYENGKCFKTRALCDLCKNEDEISLVRRQGKMQKLNNHNSRPFTAMLSRLSEKFAFISRNW